MGYAIRLRARTWIVDPVTRTILLKPDDVIPAQLELDDNTVCLTFEMNALIYQFSSNDPRITVEPVLSA